jgi:hypothetical protein
MDSKLENVNAVARVFTVLRNSSLEGSPVIELLPF